jgi:predicted DNA-binding ribbon-helix-helix protein
VGLKKRSLLLAGHATSVALEPEFWDALEVIAEHEGIGLNALVARLDQGRGEGGLASTLRLYCLRSLMARNKA